MGRSTSLSDAMRNRHSIVGREAPAGPSISFGAPADSSSAAQTERCRESRLISASRPRLNRSQLAVPGSNRRFLEKATSLPADIIMFDLEDAVAPDEKEQARRNVVQAINDLDWGERTLSVRINGLDTPYMYRDLIDLAEQAGDRLDLVMVPKTGTAADVYTVDVLLTQIEAAKRRAKRVGIELMIDRRSGCATSTRSPPPAAGPNRCTSARAISPRRSAPARSASAVRIPATACSPTPTRTAFGPRSGTTCGIIR